MSSYPDAIERKQRLIKESRSDLAKRLKREPTDAEMIDELALRAAIREQDSDCYADIIAQTAGVARKPQ